MLRRSFLVLAATGALVGAPAAGAATFTVTSTGDAPDGSAGNGVCATLINPTCTLRAAIQEANALAGADTILVPAGTYAGGSALPAITATTTITGTAGARATVVRGVAGSRVLRFTGGGTRTVGGLTLTGGSGGVYVEGPDAVLDAVAIRDNAVSSVASVNGGGIQVFSGFLTVRRSSITGNVVVSENQALGGGIALGSNVTAIVERTTIAGNSVQGLGGTFGGGLGVLNTASATLRHVTLAGNSALGPAAGQGGNIYRGPSGGVIVEDTVIADGTGSNGANCNGPALTTLGRNLDTGTSCGFGAGQIENVAARLAPLGDAGGPTDTRPPLPDSPSRDAAASCGPVTVDQRGAPAPTGPSCDIGAVEVGSDLVTTVTASRASVPAGGDVTYLVRVRNQGFDPAPAATVLVGAPGAGLVFAESSQGPCTPALLCELGDIDPGASSVATVVLRAPASGAIAVTATASSGLADPTPADAIGTRSTPIDVPAPVVPPAVPPTTPGPATPGTSVPPGADRTAPRLGALRAVGTVRRARVGRVRTTLSEDASLSVRIERVVPGRRSAGRCRTGRRRGARCSVFRLVGTVKATAKAGGVTVRLPARVKGRPLARGRHRLVVTATDAAGNRSAVRRLTVTVAR